MTNDVAALQQELAEVRRELDAERRQRVLFQQSLEHAPLGILIWRLPDLDDPRSLLLVAGNATSSAQTQTDLQAAVGRRLVDIYTDMDVRDDLLALYAQVVRSGKAMNLGEVPFDAPNNTKVTLEIQLFPLPDNHIAIIHNDITARKNSEEALRQSIHLEETIRAQDAALAELSTPLIPISDEVTVMPLVGAVDSRRAQQVMEALLEGIAQTRAHVAILDITGVPVVDTQVADALIRAAQSVKLLGAQVILTGIRPEVAQTLVGLGVDLSAIITRSSLQSGIAYATARR